MMMVSCAGCDRPILDRFLFNVLDRTWHAKCVQCSECGSSLTEKCFSRDGKLYCRDDFFRRYGTKCAGCLQGISPNDLVRRARNKVFHLKCFTCLVCRKQLSTGEELYILDENKFICKDDYLNGKYEVTSDGEENEHEANPDDSLDIKLEQSLSDKEDTMESSDPVLHLSDPKDESGQSLDSPISNSTPLGGTENGTHMDIGEPPSPLGDDDIGTESVKSEKDFDGRNNNNNEGNGKDDGDVKGGAKKRGPRTTIKAKQLETLKAAFAATPKPTRHIREQLAKETGLNMRVIQVWFQNRRSKERRMKQLSALGARRHFFRNPRRMRIDGLSPADLEDNPELLGQQGFYPFPDGGQGELLPGYQGYDGFFPGPPGEPGPMGFPGPGGPPGGMLDPQGPPPSSMGQNGQFLPPNVNDYPPTSSDHHIPSLQSSEGAPGMFSAGGPPPSSMASQFNPSLGHQPPREMGAETW